MAVLIVGGAGFVGLNIAERFVAAGTDVTVFDRAPPPAVAHEALSRGPGCVRAVTGDVTKAEDVRAVMSRGFEAVVLGAAVTAGPAREAREPELILRTNLVSHVAILAAARDTGVRRVVNLSSGAAYGEAAFRDPVLREDGPADPTSLYAITKEASERVDRRLAGLWGLDLVSVRLSAVFGPWERDTGMRDTLSPQVQIAALLEAGRPASLARPGIRDWIYAPDVADAVALLIEAKRPAHPVYNVSVPTAWTALAWGERYAAARGGTCRLAEPGEAPSVDLHGPADRAPMATDRLRDEFGWTARYGLSDSADHLAAWRDRHAAALGAGR